MKFDKYYDMYDDYSFVQKKVSKNLMDFIEENKFEKNNISSIFEIGCGTGIFTNEYLKNKYIRNFKIEKLILNDIFDIKKYFKDKTNENFSLSFEIGDILKIQIPKTDLVLSSSAFQWIENLDLLFEKLSTKTNKLAFSTYVMGNLIEIKEHFGISLNYYEAEEIETYLKKYFKNIKLKRERVVLDFETPIQVLKHLKYTGVTGLKKPSVSNIRTFNKKKLTYEVAYFICEK